MRTPEMMDALRRKVVELRDKHGLDFATIAERLSLGNRGRANNIYREAKARTSLTGDSK